MSKVSEYEYYVRKKSDPSLEGWAEIENPVPAPSSAVHTFNGSANAALLAGWILLPLDTVTGNPLLANSVSSGLEVLIEGMYTVSAADLFNTNAGKEFHAGLKVTMDHSGVVTDLTHEELLRIGDQTTETIEAKITAASIAPVRLEVGDRIEVFSYTSATALSKDSEADRVLYLNYIGP